MKLASLLLILPILAFSTEHFYQTGRDCATLETQAQAVLSWSQKLDPSFQAEIPECVCYSANSCKIDFFPISPEMVKMYNKKYAEVSGPNCWNRALVFAKILPALSYSTPEEMTHWIDSPLCQQRLADEQPQPGDIVAIRSYSSTEVHGFTYLSDTLSFSKNGYHKSSPFKYATTASVFNVYRVKRECWNVPQTPSSSSPCYRARGAFYNCQSLEGYTQSINYEPSEFVLNTLQSLAIIDHTIEEQLFDLTITDIEYYRTFYNNTVNIKNLSMDMKNDSSLHEVESFLWKAIYLRSLAVMQQLGILADQID